MPRNPAGTVRSEFSALPRHLDAIRDVRGLSPRTLREIRRLELTRSDLYRGAVAGYVEAWRREACGARCRCTEYDWWEPVDDDGHWDRDQLTDVLHRLPPPAARELRRFLKRIDDHHRSGCPGWRDCRWGRRSRTSPTWWQR